MSIKQVWLVSTGKNKFVFGAADIGVTLSGLAAGDVLDLSADSSANLVGTAVANVELVVADVD